MIAEYQRVQRIRDQAEGLFDRSWMAGRFNAVVARLLGRSNELLFLPDIKKTAEVVHFYELERQAIDLDLIQGTNGRPDRFDRGWHPVQRRDRNRWASVCLGLMQDITAMPPVELVKVNDIYYVLDGNHRVSAARALGKLFMDANVTVWETQPK